MLNIVGIIVEVKVAVNLVFVALLKVWFEIVLEIFYVKEEFIRDLFLLDHRAINTMQKNNLLSAYLVKVNNCEELVVIYQNYFSSSQYNSSIDSLEGPIHVIALPK